MDWRGAWKNFDPPICRSRPWRRRAALQPNGSAGKAGSYLEWLSYNANGRAMSTC